MTADEWDVDGCFDNMSRYLTEYFEYRLATRLPARVFSQSRKALRRTGQVVQLYVDVWMGSLGGCDVYSAPLSSFSCGKKQGTL